MDRFDKILESATVALEPEYFRLSVADGEPAYRERVYCYELYHQMRTLWPSSCEYVLNGEVDKQQHPNFANRGFPKPDFIVHVPGTHDNFAVIEVKGPSASPAGIRNDLCKLLRFGEWYRRRLYLVYGVGPGVAADWIRECVENHAELEAIELWVHPTQGAAAARVRLDADEESRS